MQKYSPSRFLVPLLFLLLTALTAAISEAAGTSGRTTSVSAAATQTAAGYPFDILSQEADGLLIAEVSGVVGYPYPSIRDALIDPAAWCQFLPLVFNIKSCTYHRRAGQHFLTLYLGRKFFEPPQNAIQLEYLFRVQRSDESSLQILLTAADGPYGTSDYTIEIEVVAAGDVRTRVRMHSSFRPSLASRVATRLYLLTIGRTKVGFSVTGFKAGTPVYCGGIKGIVERNAMRYYFALKSYLDTMHLPQSQRFEARLDAWYKLTARYHRQLYEMDKAVYLDAKRRERQGQLQLQQRSDAAFQP